MNIIFLLSRAHKLAQRPALGAKLLLLTTASIVAPLTQAAICEYKVVDEWNVGFKGEISIVNEGDEAINDWSMSWTWEAGTTLNNSWNASFNCASETCTATPISAQSAIAAGQTYTFGFIANKGLNPLNQNIVLNGEVCESTSTPSPITTNLWLLDGDRSSIEYVSVKKAHTAELNTFIAEEGQAPALSGSISKTGDAVFTINLNDVSTGVALRNSRLVSLLFETDFLPLAYVRAHVDSDLLSAMAVGETHLLTLAAELSLHGIKQALSAEVLIVKTSASAVSISTIEPLLIDSNSFDMSYGIELLRTVADLTSIGEVVPVYFHLNYVAATDAQPIAMPDAPNAPSSLTGSFDPVEAEASLNWQDNSINETLFLVRRKLLDGQWQTIANLSSNVTTFTEGLPEEGEYDYKTIAVNQGVPSEPSNISRVTVTEGNQLVRGMKVFKDKCAGCHGERGEGLRGFPALNTERDVETMINVITTSMPKNNASACDEQCARDIATFIQTLWVPETVCNVDGNTTIYGPRQLKLLTRTEYQNSLEDLLGIDFNAGQRLSADTKVGLFANNAHSSVVASSYSNQLLVAESVAQWAAEQNFSPALSCSVIDQTCVDQFMDNLAPKIFRRSLSEDEIATFKEIAEGTYTGGDVKQGIALALEGMLSSPQFLYRHELGEVNPDNSALDNGAFELTSYEMATFLAYTFTGSTPDQVLLEAAARDELRTESTIIEHANRLAGNAKSVVSDFVGSWLGTADLASAVKDSAAWPNFSALVPHMQNEVNETFSHIMLSDEEQFASLYTANYTYLNQALSEHYALGGVTGGQMQRVETTDRGGILASGAFMARWGEAVETSPILRSVRVRRRMLCQDQPAPPAGTFEAREKKLAELSDLLKDPMTTNRFKYHRLTEDSPCTNCHTQYINPLGFGMEDFDTVGRVRTNDLKGNAINASGELFAPTNYSDVDESIPFEGTRGLGSVLAELPSAQVCLPKQMFRYFMGVGDHSIDDANPEGPQLANEEKSGYACEIEKLTQTMLNESPRAMLERFGTLQAVRYRKAWSRH